MSMPPTAPIAFTKSRDFVMKSQKALIDTYSWECCINCEHWSESNIVQVPDATKFSGFSEQDRGPLCTKYDMHPPTDVVLIGCAEYVPGIPF